MHIRLLQISKYGKRVFCLFLWGINAVLLNGSFGCAHVIISVIGIFKKSSILNCKFLFEDKLLIKT